MPLMVANDGEIEIIEEFVRIRASLEGAINRRIRCPEVAADLASDMYMKLLRLQPRAETVREAWSYLHRMASSIAIDQARSQRRRREILQESEDLIRPDVAPDPEATALANDGMRVIEAALAELPAKCRDVLMLSRMHGMTHAEIAGRLGVSRSLVEKYLMRAMRHCRDRLREARWQTEPGIDD